MGMVRLCLLPLVPATRLQTPYCCRATAPEPRRSSEEAQLLVAHTVSSSPGESGVRFTPVSPNLCGDGPEDTLARFSGKEGCPGQQSLLVSSQACDLHELLGVYVFLFWAARERLA